MASKYEDSDVEMEDMEMVNATNELAEKMNLMDINTSAMVLGRNMTPTYQGNQRREKRGEVQHFEPGDIVYSIIAHGYMADGGFIEKKGRQNWEEGGWKGINIGVLVDDGINLIPDDTSMPNCREHLCISNLADIWGGKLKMYKRYPFFIQGESKSDGKAIFPNLSFSEGGEVKNPPRGTPYNSKNGFLATIVRGYHGMPLHLFKLTESAKAKQLIPLNSTDNTTYKLDDGEPSLYRYENTTTLNDILDAVVRDAIGIKMAGNTVNKINIVFGTCLEGITPDVAAAMRGEDQYNPPVRGGKRKSRKRRSKKKKTKKRKQRGGYTKKEKAGDEYAVWYDTSACSKSNMKMCQSRGDNVSSCPVEESTCVEYHPVSYKTSIGFTGIKVKIFNLGKPVKVNKGNILLNKDTSSGTYDMYYIYLDQHSKTGGSRWELKEMKNVSLISNGNGSFKLTYDRWDDDMKLQINNNKITVYWPENKKWDDAVNVGTFWLSNKKGGYKKKTRKRK